jgi:hypothetical protein
MLYVNTPFDKFEDSNAGGYLIADAQVLIPGGNATQICDRVCHPRESHKPGLVRKAKLRGFLGRLRAMVQTRIVRLLRQSAKLLKYL